MNAGELRRLKDACTQRPQDPQAWAKLGVASKQQGELAEAIKAYRTSLQLRAAQPRTWANLARALRESGDLPGAIDAFRSAVALDAQFAEGFSMLSNALREHRNLPDALEAARRSIALKPDLAEAHLNEGAALHALGRLREATVSYLVSLVLAPTPSANANLDKALAKLVNEPFPEVEVIARLKREPHDPSALRELGVLLISQDRAASAAILFEQSHKLAPSADVMFLRAFIERRAGRDGPAEAFLRAGLALDPGHQGCLDALGAVLVLSGRLTEARGVLERAISETPDSPELLLNYANVCREFAEHERALTLCKQAIALAPERPELESVALFSMHFDPAFSPQALLDAHRAYGKRFQESARITMPGPAREPKRTLRVGYVSADLRTHPVAHFIEPILRNHDPERVEVFVYSDVAEEDAVTRRLKKLVPHWCDSARLSADQLASRISADEIDILIDLSGHTAATRLPVFAQKPAPVQASWIGYFDTTGLSAIDYRIADAFSVPPGAERLFVEQVLRLPRTANCFAPIPGAPAVAPSPCQKNGFVTFGCFSQPSKLNREVVRTFAGILRRVPASKLVLKYATYKDAGLRDQLKQWFDEQHVDASRIVFRGHAPLDSYPQAFAEIDIALDPFPYSGETSTLHALWMGVPVLAIEGDTMARRLAARVLRVVGLDGWITTNPDEYVERAVTAASDPAALAALRSTLRQKLEASPLLDHAGVTRELEDAYRTMWQRHEPSTR